MATGEISSIQKFRRSVDKVMRRASVAKIKEKMHGRKQGRYGGKNRSVRIIGPRDDAIRCVNSRGDTIAEIGDDFVDTMGEGDLCKRISNFERHYNLRGHIEDRAQSAAEFARKRPGLNRYHRENTFPGEQRQYTTNLINWAMSVASGHSRGSDGSWEEESNGSAMSFLLRRYATSEEINAKSVHQARAREKIKKKLALPVDRIARIATLRQNVRFIEGKFRSMLHKQRAALESREDLKSSLSNGHQPEYWPSRFLKPGEALFFFRSRTRMIVICMRWIKMIMAMNKNSSWEKELKSFVDLSLDMGEGGMYTDRPEVMDGLQFDKNEFKANREISLSMDVKTILSLRPEARTPEMCKQVMLGLQTLQSLSEYPLDTQQQLCRVAWFQQVPARKHIIRQGHHPEAFYFILSGLAVVKKIEIDPATEEEQTRVVARLTRGQSFGELGLIFKTPRNATVESGTPMELLVVGKQDFLKIFMHNVKPGEDPDHIAFLKQQPVLRFWPFEHLKEDPGACLINYFKRGTLITESGKASEWIYFVKAGSCVALKRLKAVTPRTRAQLRVKLMEETEDFQLPNISSKYNNQDDSKKQSIHPELYRSMTEYYDNVRTTAEQDAKKSNGTTGRSSKGRGKSLGDSDLSMPEIGESSRSSITSQPYFHRTPPGEPTVSLPPIKARNSAGPAISQSKFTHLSRKMDKGNLMVPTTTSLQKTYSEKNLNLAESVQTARDEKEDVYVTVEKLQTRDIFGMNTVAFSDEDIPDQDIPEVALVSKGAEIVMLSKKMFLKHAEERVKLCVQELMAPYPKEAQLQENLQIKADWHVYRNEVLRDVLFTNYALKNTSMTGLV